MKIFPRGHSVSQNGGAPFRWGLHHKLSITSSASFAFMLSSTTAPDLPSWPCLVSQFRSPIRNAPLCGARTLPFGIAPLQSLYLCLGSQMVPLPLLAINSLEHLGTRTKDNMEDKSIIPFPTIPTGTMLLIPALCQKAARSRKPTWYKQGGERRECERVCFSC